MAFLCTRLRTPMSSRDTPDCSDQGSLHETPATSPPTSRPRSPDLKYESTVVPTYIYPALQPALSAVGNICFVGAGFVGGPTAALIAFYNPSILVSVSALCEELNADVQEVSPAIGADSRLGQRFLQAGVGFGGSCFEKDILNLAYMARTLHLDEVADYWMSVLDINRYQRERFTRKAVEALNGSLRGKKVAIFGFAFKEGTNDTRNSIAVHIIAELGNEMPAEIAIFDPGCNTDAVLQEVRRVVVDEKKMARIKILPNWRDVVGGASSLCILTSWYHFRYPPNLQAVGRRLSVWDGGHSTHEVGSFFKESMSEMNIMDLEKFVSRGNQVLLQDPLKRMVPQPPCSKECKDCAAKRPAGSSPESEVVDWAEVASVMRQPRLVLDGRNVVNGSELEKLGFTVRSVGKGRSF